MAAGACKCRPRELRKTQRRKKRKKKSFPLEGAKGVQKGPSGARKGPKGGLVAQRNKKERGITNPTSLFVHCFHVSKMSWYLDWGLDLKIPILSCFFLKMDNF
jgi:hypothetical protein